MPTTIYTFFIHANMESTAVQAPSSSTTLGG